MCAVRTWGGDRSASRARRAFAETTLEKINRTGTLTIGTRTGSPPVRLRQQAERVGRASPSIWSSSLIQPEVSKKLGKPIKLEKKESTPATRIPLLSSSAVDLIAGTMTDTRPRRDSVDFSLTFFVTGAQFLVKKGSPIKGIQDIGGKRIAAQQGSTNARIIRERVPTAQLREFPDQPAGFQALAQGQVDAYTNDGIQLAGLKAKAPEPGRMGRSSATSTPTSRTGWRMRKGDSDFRAVVNTG